MQESQFTILTFGEGIPGWLVKVDNIEPLLTSVSSQKLALFKRVHLNEALSTEDVVKKLAQRGLRPATLDELDYYHELTRGSRRKYPIVALGSRVELPTKTKAVCVLGPKDEIGWCGESPNDLWAPTARFLATVIQLALPF
ncbi:MAG: hypothetical protein U0487_00145 [Patescibacteria group bacterium]